MITTGSDGGADGEASLARLHVIRPVGAEYERAGATACLVVGSVARGWADQWSDVELLIVWPVVPTEPDRRAIAVAAGIDNWRAFPDADPLGATEEDGSINGLKVDIAHLSTPEVAVILQRLLASDALGGSLAEQRFAGSVQDAVVLAGADWVEQRRQDLARYPDGLARRTIEEHLVFGPHAWLRMLGKRGDPIPLNDILGRIGRSLMVIWFAVNGRFVRMTDGKWALRHVAEFSVIPSDTHRRLEAMFQSPPAVAAGLAVALIDDTLTLVDQSLAPEVTNAVRHRVAAAQRNPWRSQTSR